MTHLSAAVRAAAQSAAVLFAFFAPALPCPAVQRDAPRFFGEETQPSAGFVVPAMQGARQVPAKPVEVVRYHCRLGDREWDEERSNMDELWRASQQLAAWRDNRGNEITFAKVVCSLPPALAGLDVTRETFEDVLDNPDFALEADSATDKLAFWAADFAGIPTDGSAGEILPPVAIPVNSARFAKIYGVPLPDPTLRVFLMRLNPTFPGHGKAPRSWWAFVVRFATAPAPGDRDADRMLRTDFLGAIRTVGWRDVEKAVARDSKRHMWSGADERDVPDDPVRAEARDSVALLDDWWYMESPHYIALSDDPAAERSADSLLGSLEALLPRYAALVPPFRNRQISTGVIRIFRRSEEFDAYFAAEGTPLGLSSTAGLFSPSRRELAIRPPGRRSAQDVASIVRHEAFHQYLFSAWGGNQASPWFNEGTAELFSGYKPRGNGSFECTELEYHAGRLEKLARSRDVDWNALVRYILLCDWKQFYSPSAGDSGAGINYAMAYGIACFLHRGAPFVRGQPYKDVLPTYYEILERTGNPTAATAAAFQMGRNGAQTRFLDKFADDLRQFWKSESARRQSQRAKVP